MHNLKKGQTTNNMHQLISQIFSFTSEWTNSGTFTFNNLSFNLIFQLTFLQLNAEIQIDQK